MTLSREVEQALIEVTEVAAIASARTMGRGDRHLADQLATEAMRTRLGEVDIDGRIVIGEGERDEAPMLFIGEELGAGVGRDDVAAIDIAVDPLEGTNLCATGSPGAVCVLAASERGGLLHAPDVYMEKIVVGPTARGSIHLDAPVAENLEGIAKALGRQVEDLTIVVLERDRHQQLIEDIRATGARIHLLTDGDLAPAIAAAVRGTGVHAVMGVGGAPEGVITAAAMRCLGGEIQGRLATRTEKQERRLEEVGVENPERLLHTEDLAPGEEIVFSCTGVTKGDLLESVRFFGGGSRTHTLFMSSSRNLIRFVDTIHRESAATPVLF
ncbi:MAG: class II fructose-bisphosphatase [Acidobacteriota bacterium]|nr:class II fructose-bisphosphatase [Acidobacteriota bacterium]